MISAASIVGPPRARMAETVVILACGASSLTSAVWPNTADTFSERTKMKSEYLWFITHSCEKGNISRKRKLCGCTLVLVGVLIRMTDRALILYGLLPRVLELRS